MTAARIEVFRGFGGFGGFAASLLALVLVGCGSSSPTASPGSGSGGSTTAPSCAQPLPAQVVNASTVSPIPSDSDPSANPTPNTTIFFSLLLPPRCPGQTFPVVLDQPGWGGSRISSLAANGDLHGSDPMFPSIDELVQALPDHGYVVISIDPRGLGESVPANGGGNARVMDPAAEVQDTRAVIDWAYEHASQYQIQTQPDSGIPEDIKVGTIGYSYGGGYQMPLAALDPRVDTIVPVGTWHDLLYSLLPGNSVKLSYDGLLCLLSSTGGMSLTPLVQSLCNAVGVKGSQAFDLRSRGDLDTYLSGSKAKPRMVSDAQLAQFFGTHGMNYFYRQQQAGQPWGFPGSGDSRLRPVPALFLQGNRDVLFNLTEGYWNWRYFQAAGGDARILSTEGGHMNPLANQKEGDADCGAQIGVQDVLAWFNHYLKGEDSATFDAIPTVCISVADTVGAPDVAPAGLQLKQFPVGQLSGPGSVPASLSRLDATVGALAIAPVFVPVTTISQAGSVLAGAPTIGSLTVAPGQGAISSQSTNAFVGVGIRRGGKTFLVDDQVTAFTEGSYTDNPNVAEDPRILLPAVGEQLQVGDQIGLLFYPQNIQYAAIVSAVGLGGVTGIISYISGKSIPPITSALNPVLGLLYDNPYQVSATDVELPILVPGQYPDSQLTH